MHIEYAGARAGSQRGPYAFGVERAGDILKFILKNGKRAAVLVVGLAFVVLGLAMLVLPGPGILVVILGLAILATEFVWARYLLDKAKDQATKAKDKIRRRRKSKSS